MASRHEAVAGVAMQPVMDLSDSRVIAYRAIPRATGGDLPPVDFLDAALAAAPTTSPAPLLISLDPRLLVSPTFDAVARGRSANCAPSEVVWVMPDAKLAAAAWPDLPPAPVLAAAIRRHSAMLREAGYRIGLDAVRVLSVSWEDVVVIRPTFLLLDEELTMGLADDLQRAALAGLLAFAGHIGARLVARDVDNAQQADALMDVGLYYGMGKFLHGPVVLDEAMASEGDSVVRPSWFRERSVRKLSMYEEEDGTKYVPQPPRLAVVDDRRLASLLTEWAGVLSNAENPDAVMDEVARIVPQIVSFDRLAVFEADWDRYALSARVLIGEQLQPLVGSSNAINKGITGWAFLAGVPYRCGKTTDHPDAAPIPGQVPADESLIVIPLVSGERRLGALDIWRDGADQFTESDLERAALIGKLGADAWRRAAEREELAERVVTDTATGLLNKRWWDELAPREAAQSRRSGASIAVLLVDLDGFKEDNDSYGHAAGDAVLKHVARALQSTVRSGDAVIRYGGDEFILMLRDCDETGAFEVATDVQLALARVALPGGQGAALGASIGIAFFPEHGPTLDDVAGRADTAMYRAKAAGGGRIVAFSPVEEPHGPADEIDAELLAGEAAGEQEGLLAVDRGRLRQELEEHYRRFQFSESLSRMGSFEMDLGTGVMEWSPEMYRVLGASIDEVPSVPGIVDRVHPDDMERYGAAVSKWVESGWGHFELGIWIIRSDDGQIVPAYLTQEIHTLPDRRRLLSGTLQELPHTPDDAAELNQPESVYDS